MHFGMIELCTQKSKNVPFFEKAYAGYAKYIDFGKNAENGIRNLILIPGNLGSDLLAPGSLAVYYIGRPINNVFCRRPGRVPRRNRGLRPDRVRRRDRVRRLCRFEGGLR